MRDHQHTSSALPAGRIYIDVDQAILDAETCCEPHDRFFAGLTASHGDEPFGFLWNVPEIHRAPGLAS